MTCNKHDMWLSYEKKGMFLYSAVSSPLDSSKRFTLFLPWQTCSLRPNSASLGSILAMHQLRATTIHSHVHHCLRPGTHFIQLSERGVSWRERKCPNFETVAKGDSNPGSLDCESGIQSLSYSAPKKKVTLTSPCHVSVVLLTWPWVSGCRVSEVAGWGSTVRWGGIEARVDSDTSPL